MTLEYIFSSDHGAPFNKLVPTAEERADSLLEILSIATWSKAQSRGYLIAALREHADAAVEEERNLVNSSAVYHIGIAAKKLAEIARTGKHEGTFCGKEMEEAAQAIIDLRSDLISLRATVEELRRGRDGDLKLVEVAMARGSVNAELLAVVMNVWNIFYGETEVPEYKELAEKANMAISNAKIANAEKANPWRRMPVPNSQIGSAHWCWFCTDLSRRDLADAKCVYQRDGKWFWDLDEAGFCRTFEIGPTDGWWLSIPDERQSAGVES